MKAVVPLSDLARITTAAGRAVGPAIARPVLGGIHLALADGHLTATGTDLDLTIAATCEVDGGDPGAAVVPAKDLIKIVSRLGSAKVDSATVETTEDRLTLAAGPFRVELALLPADEWPRAPQVDGKPQPVDAGTWAILGRIAVAASDDHQRPILSAVHLGPGVAETTDSFRAYTAEIPEGLDALIPARAVTDAAAILGDGPVTIATDDNHARMATPAVSVTTRLVAGEFWALDRLIAVDRSHTITLDTGALATALMVTEGIAVEKGQSGAAILDVTTEAVTVGRASSKSDAKGVVACTADTATRLRVNPAYLLDALDLTTPDGGPVTIDYDKPTGSVLLRGDRLVAVVALVHPLEGER